MAILVYGVLCRLCGKPMLRGQDLVMFPPFVANEADPLLKFSDGAFHRECFLSDPLSGRAESRLAEIKERSNRADWVCPVCGKLINDPDDFFSLDHLTDDRLNPLHPLNYVKLHKSCLPRWLELKSTRILAEKQLESGAWAGGAMEKLVDDLRKAEDSIS
jgi:hypothetical protein